MKEREAILITGSNGSVGSALRRSLEERGHRVYGLSRKGGDSRTLQCDLLDSSSLERALREAPPFGVVIHSASVKPGAGKRDFASSVRMTENLVAHLDPSRTRLIHLSSVDVYGLEARERMARGESLSPLERPDPPDAYGRSKARSEEVVREAGFSSFHIVRVAPVYGADAMENLKKRVFIPGSSWKLQLKPPPRYSFCSMETLLAGLIHLVEHPRGGGHTSHLCDEKLLSRTDLTALFPGRVLTLPASWLRLPGILLRLVPGERGLRWRSLFHKVFSSTDYRPGRVEVPEEANRTGRLETGKGKTGTDP